MHDKSPLMVSAALAQDGAESTPLLRRISVFLFLLLGVGALMPFNSVLSALDYFEQLFPNRKPAFLFPLVYLVGNVAAYCPVLVWAQLFSVHKRIVAALLAYACILGAVPAVDALLHGHPSVVFGSFVALFFMCGCLDALFQGALFGVAALFPSSRSQAILTGLSVAGLSSNVLRAVTKLSNAESNRGRKTSAQMFFGLSAGYMVACIVFYALLCRYSPPPGPGEQHRQVDDGPQYRDAVVMDDVDESAWMHQADESGVHRDADDALVVVGGDDGDDVDGGDDVRDLLRAEVVCDTDQVMEIGDGSHDVGGADGDAVGAEGASRLGRKGRHRGRGGRDYGALVATLDTDDADDAEGGAEGRDEGDTDLSVEDGEERDDDQEPLFGVSALPPLRIMTVIRSPAILVMLTFTVALCVFPGVVVVIPPRLGVGEDWYPLVIVAAFNVGDVIGRAVSHLRPFCNVSLSQLWVLGWGRLAFVPFFVAAAAGHWASEPMVLAMLFIFAATSGFICVSCFGRAPDLVDSHAEKEWAGTLMAFSLTLGLTVGSGLGYVSSFLL